MNFIITAENFNAKTGEQLDTAHWIVSARDLEQAQGIGEGQVTNANRTIPSVEGRFVKVEPFNLKVCEYLRRNINCQGHRARPQLAQQRGGNES